MNLQTLAIHAGYEKDAQSTMAVPLYMSTAYEFRDTEHAVITSYSIHYTKLYDTQCSIDIGLKLEVHRYIRIVPICNTPQ